MNILRGVGNSALPQVQCPHSRVWGHLPPPPLHPERLNTIMSNIIQVEKMTPEHSFSLNVFIKSICQFMDWSELEESVGADRSC